MAKTKKAVKPLITDLSMMLSEIAVEGIQEKKGKDIVSLDLRNIKNAVTDYFIVCHGESRTQVEAIARSVEEEIFRKTGENPWHREGFENAEWILLDYINIVVHIFQQEKRDFYGIERLWADAEIKKL
jgi:ribosome-associated protein